MLRRSTRRQPRRKFPYTFGYTTLVRIARDVGEAENIWAKKRFAKASPPLIQESVMKMFKQLASESLIYLTASFLVVASLYYVDLLGR
jgi:hypothetical protein